VDRTRQVDRGQVRLVGKTENMFIVEAATSRLGIKRLGKREGEPGRWVSPFRCEGTCDTKSQANVELSCRRGRQRCSGRK